MTKRKIISHESQKCTSCKHEKIYHQGISGTCYYPNCKCVRFRLKKGS